MTGNIERPASTKWPPQTLRPGAKSAYEAEFGEGAAGEAGAGRIQTANEDGMDFLST